MEVYQVEVCLEGVPLEGVVLEGVHLEEESQVEVGPEEVGPLEEALGPMGLGVHPSVVEAQEVLVDLVDLEDQVDPSHLHSSVANLPLPSSCQVDHH